MRQSISRLYHRFLPYQAIASSVLYVVCLVAVVVGAVNHFGWVKGLAIGAMAYLHTSK